MNKIKTIKIMWDNGQQVIRYIVNWRDSYSVRTI